MIFRKKKQELNEEKVKNLGLVQKNEKLCENYKSNFEKTARECEKLRQIIEEKEVQFAKMKVFEGDLEETRRSLADLEAQTMQKDKKLNEMSIKLKEIEPLLEEKERIIVNLQKNLQEFVEKERDSEGNLNKSAYFSLNNSGISKNPQQISTLKSQISENYSFDGGKKCEKETQCEEIPEKSQENEKIQSICAEKEEFLRKNETLSQENIKLRLDINENKEYLKKISCEKQKVRVLQVFINKNKGFCRTRGKREKTQRNSAEFRRNF